MDHRADAELAPQARAGPFDDGQDQAAGRRVEAPEPDGGMYAFFRVEGESDSVALARRLVADHGLGLAPGAAFGPEGEGWLRWCFASSDPERLVAGVERLAAHLRL